MHPFIGKAHPLDKSGCTKGIEPDMSFHASDKVIHQGLWPNEILAAKLVSRGQFTYADDFFPASPCSSKIVAIGAQKQRHIDYGRTPSGSWQVYTSALVLHEKQEIRG
jgi:hypothetical protein